MSDSKTKRLVDELAAAKNEYHLLTTDEESPQQQAATANRSSAPTPTPCSTWCPTRNATSAAAASGSA